MTDSVDPQLDSLLSSRGLVSSVCSQASLSRPQAEHRLLLSRVVIAVILMLCHTVCSVGERVKWVYF